MPSPFLVLPQDPDLPIVADGRGHPGANLHVLHPPFPALLPWPLHQPLGVQLMLEDHQDHIRDKDSILEHCTTGYFHQRHPRLLHRWIAHIWHAQCHFTCVFAVGGCG